MITQQLLEKFERYYGKGMARLVLFADWSGHTEVRDSAAWQYDFAFEDIAQLEAHLTKRAPDSSSAVGMDSESTESASG